MKFDFSDYKDIEEKSIVCIARPRKKPRIFAG